MTSNEKEVSQFLSSTFAMVNDASDAIVSWVSDGESFMVWDTKLFASDVLGQYFQHNNFSSFVRQMNLYSFTKTADQGHNNFSHPHFKRGRVDLLKKIKRKRASQSSTKSHEAAIRLLKQNNINTSTELGSMKESHTRMNESVSSLRSENAALWSLVREHEESQATLNESMQGVLMFLMKMFPNEVKESQLPPSVLSVMGKKRTTTMLMENACESGEPAFKMRKVGENGFPVGEPGFGSFADDTGVVPTSPTAAEENEAFYTALISNDVSAPMATSDHSLSSDGMRVPDAPPSFQDPELAFPPFGDPFFEDSSIPPMSDFPLASDQFSTPREILLSNPGCRGDVYGNSSIDPRTLDPDPVSDLFSKASPDVSISPTTMTDNTTMNVNLTASPSKPAASSKLSPGLRRLAASSSSACAVQDFHLVASAAIASLCTMHQNYLARTAALTSYVAAAAQAANVEVCDLSSPLTSPTDAQLRALAHKFIKTAQTRRGPHGQNAPRSCAQEARMEAGGGHDRPLIVFL